MCISISQWRARVGVYDTRRATAHRTQKLKQIVWKWNFMDILSDGAFKCHLLVLLALLVIGNVELNPGPATVFRCKLCTYESVRMKDVAAHQRIHSAEKNFVFSCPGPVCWETYKTFPGLCAHIRTFHSSPREEALQENQDVNSVSCVITPCQQTLSGSRALCSHLIEHLNAGDSFDCPYRDSCESRVRFSSVQQFRSHLSIKHPGWRQDSLGQPQLSRIILTFDHSTADDNVNENEYFDALETSSEDVSEEPPFTPEMFVKHMARFYLMLSAECFLAEKVVQTISEHMATLSELVQYWYREEIVKKLREEGLEEGSITCILNAILPRDVFYSTHHKEAPGPSLISTHLRKEYFNSNFVCIEPEEISIDKDKEGGEVVHYVSVKKTLEALLEDPSVKEQVLESFVRSPNNEEVYRDYYDAQIYKKNPDLEDHIDLILGQDGFKSSKNPLGSAANDLRYDGTYFVIGNLKPENRTMASSINLALLVKESLLKDKKYGPEKCLKPLIDELKQLKTSGVRFNNHIVPVRVQHMCCDNLGAHAIGGFVESFTGTYFCRFCEITSDEFHLDPLLVKPLRTVASYEESLEELEAMRVYHRRLENLRGLKRSSPLNALPDFHVADPRLPPCLAHDMFENGVVSCDFKLMILHFVKEKWFTFAKLNKFIKNFKYIGQDLKNKPASVPEPKEVKSKHKLGGHAVQNWYLLRLFPFIIESRIKDPQDKVWKLYLKLKLLVEYISAPSFTARDLIELEDLIKSYIESRQEDLPQVFVKPKYHFLLHYVDMIKLFGPLIYLWTLRFEAKHQFFKRIMRVCNNTVNAGLTMARRHQLWFSYLTSGVIFPDGVGSSSKKTPLNVDDHEVIVKDALKSYGFTENALETSKVTYNHIDYTKGSYVIFEKDQLDSLKVGLVQTIIVDKGKTFLVLKKYESELLSQYGLYNIHDEQCTGIEIIHASSLKYPVSLSVYDFKKKLCFSLKHKIV